MWQDTYKPWGEVQSISGTRTNNLRFPGQYFQIETNLAYNWHRHYDPTTGRYTQPDPLRFVDGPSVYAYAGNSPFMYTDRNGRGIVGVIVGGVIGGLGGGIEGAAIGGAWGAGGGTLVVPGVGTVVGGGGGTVIGGIGGAIGGGLTGAALGSAWEDWLTGLNYCPVMLSSSTGDDEHTKNARPSTQEKHERGRARRAQDQGGEKGDDNRDPYGKRPPDWKGPWPPKS